jgi:hypothetical protein
MLPGHQIKEDDDDDDDDGDDSWGQNLDGKIREERCHLENLSTDGKGKVVPVL